MQKLKRICACLLAFVMLTAASVPAAAMDEKTALRHKIANHYYSALAGSGKESLGGYCGLMTSWQLYLLGVTQSLETNHGNNQYDYYKDKEFTSGGHHVTAYPVTEYTLEEALYAATGYGIRNAYNLLVGFQWTNTAAGAAYGHAVVIYAIIDGMVYFTEGFSTSLGSAEGQAIVVSIPEFARYYADWTKYEGTIEFGKKDLAYGRRSYAVEGYYSATQDIDMYSQPVASPEEDDQAYLVRKVKAGEHLYVTGLYEGVTGKYYYKISGESRTGYLPVEMLKLLSLRQIVPTIHKAELTQRIEAGTSPDLQIQLTLPKACTAELVLTDALGQMRTAVPMVQKNGLWQASGDILDIRSQEEGTYLVSVTASRGHGAIVYGGPVTILQEETVLELPLYIGNDAQPLQPESEEPFKDGWNYRNDTWYYYKDGAPYVGWLCDCGRDYYLREDGSITTGWAEILGKFRYFGHTGVMHTGWIEDRGNTYYLMCNGAPATGWREIDGQRYYFGGNGVMYRDAWLEEEDKAYYLQQNGTPLTDGWYDTEYGRLLFDAQGCADTQMVQQDGKTVILPWTPENPK